MGIWVLWVAVLLPLAEDLYFNWPRLGQGEQLSGKGGEQLSGKGRKQLKKKKKDQ